MKPGLEHSNKSLAASRELAAIEAAFKQREKQLPVLPVFLVVALGTCLYHLLVGF